MIKSTIARFQMNKIAHVLSSILISTLCCSFVLAQAQFTPTFVEKSDQIIIHQGTRYYIHTVKKGHTLYSICKAYDTNVDQLQKSNPNIELATLSVGQALKVPVITPRNAYVATNNSQPNEKYIQHVVKPKETLYSLSKKYNVSIDDIYDHNPNSRVGIRIGEILLMPNKSYSPPVIQEEDISAELYQVKQGDTLYRISQTLGVSINEMLVTNPDLRWGLKAGQKLIIPSEKTNIWIQQSMQSDSVFTVLKQFELPKTTCDSIASSKQHHSAVKVAILLPFLVDQSLHPDTASYIDSTGAIIKPKKRGLKGRVAAELYEGVLLALDSLRQNSIHVSAFVYDTEADTTRVKEILNELEIIEPDLIFGPLAARNINLVSRYSFENKIPFIPPLTQNNTELNTNPFAFQTIPSKKVIHHEYSKYIARQLDTTGIVMVYMNNMKYKTEAEEFKSVLLEQVKLYYEPDSGFIREVYIDDNLQVNLDSSLYDSINNRVLVFSSYEPDVINVLSQLHFLLRDHQIEAYGFPEWQKFENARIDVLHELSVTLYTPFYINYNDARVRTFINKCRNTLKTEPYKTSKKGINYTFLGYDLAMYFITGSHTYKNKICQCTGHYSNPQLLSGYQYKHNINQQYLTNNSISILRYTGDYEVVKEE